MSWLLVLGLLLTHFRLACEYFMYLTDSECDPNTLLNLSSM